MDICPCVGAQSETALARMGCTRLTHGYLMSLETQPFCDDCLVPLTVRHFLVQCLSVVEMRERYLFRCRDEDGTFQMSLILKKGLSSRDMGSLILWMRLVF